ncbi:MAG TPA: ABC transporter permease [Blastocatellia bacterium]|nr:ABC transporter permease [Blastocatellia bacterium]
MGTYYSTSSEALAPPPSFDTRGETVIRAPSMARLELGGNLIKLWQYRDLFYTLSLHRIRVRYKQTALGILWALVQPLAIMLIFTLIFSVIARMPSEGAAYPVFAYTALLPWTFFSTALLNATNSLVNNSQLITKVSFPREILPLTYVAAALFDFIIGSVALVALITYYRVPLTLNYLYALPIIFLLAMLAAATSFLLSATQVRFRDIGVGMPLLLQVWMFATPVVYPLSAVPENLRGLYSLNPVAGLIENFRRVVLYNTPPDYFSMGISAAVTAVLLVVGYARFKRVEATMADMI